MVVLHTLQQAGDVFGFHLLVPSLCYHKVTQACVRTAVAASGSSSYDREAIISTVNSIVSGTRGKNVYCAHTFPACALTQSFFEQK